MIARVLEHLAIGKVFIDIFYSVVCFTPQNGCRVRPWWNVAVSTRRYPLALLRIIVGGFQIAFIGWFHFMATRTEGISRSGLNADLAARRDRNKRDDGNDEDFCSF